MSKFSHKHRRNGQQTQPKERPLDAWLAAIRRDPWEAYDIVGRLIAMFGPLDKRLLLQAVYTDFAVEDALLTCIFRISYGAQALKYYIEGQEHRIRYILSKQPSIVSDIVAVLNDTQSNGEAEYTAGPLGELLRVMLLCTAGSLKQEMLDRHALFLLEHLPVPRLDWSIYQFSAWAGIIHPCGRWCLPNRDEEAWKNFLKRQSEATGRNVSFIAAMLDGIRLACKRKPFLAMKEWGERYIESDDYAMEYNNMRAELEGMVFCLEEAMRYGYLAAPSEEMNELIGVAKEKITAVVAIGDNP